VAQQDLLVAQRGEQGRQTLAEAGGGVGGERIPDEPRQRQSHGFVVAGRRRWPRPSGADCFLLPLDGVVANPTRGLRVTLPGWPESPGRLDRAVGAGARALFRPLPDGGVRWFADHAVVDVRPDGSTRSAALPH
jgi:hypothetical protein